MCCVLAGKLVQLKGGGSSPNIPGDLDSAGDFVANDAATNNETEEKRRIQEKEKLKQQKKKSVGFHDTFQA
jgi:hypothetical protein